MADDWLEVTVEVAGVDSELVADVLRPHCPGGVAIEAAFREQPNGEDYFLDRDAPTLIKGYLPPGGESLQVRRSLRLALRFAPLRQPPRWRRFRLLKAEDWRDSWKRHFGVLHIGHHIVVKPSWVAFDPSPEDLLIEIDPGMAFGTGQHPTTALCLGALEDLVRPGMAALDLGCGSGLLAIAAARLRAASVLALDVDPQAVEAARRNVAANGVAHMVEVRQGTLDVERLPGRFDLIAANISGLTIERLAPAFARALNPKGRLIASGFLEDAIAGLSRALEQCALFVERVEADGVWRAIIARRAADAESAKA